MTHHFVVCATRDYGAVQPEYGDHETFKASAFRAIECLETSFSVHGDSDFNLPKHVYHLF
jgi:hypothetical protein